MYFHSSLLLDYNLKFKLLTMPQYLRNNLELLPNSDYYLNMSIYYQNALDLRIKLFNLHINFALLTYYDAYIILSLKP